MSTMLRRRKKLSTRNKNKKCKTYNGLLLGIAGFLFVVYFGLIVFVTTDVWSIGLSMATSRQAVLSPPAHTKQIGSAAVHGQNQTSIRKKNTVAPLPRWISDYVLFHKQTRERYSGSSLFTDPNAPKILIRTCLGLCGGLNDRLGQLPFDLYLANVTQRILLIHWVKPRQLTDFLLPNELDWTVPDGVPGLDKYSDKSVRALPSFSCLENCIDEDFNLHLQEILHGNSSHEKILKFRTLFHTREPELEQRWRELGERDMIHSTPTFGNIFRLFFKPSPQIEAEILQTKTDLNLSPNQSYIAVHCRVRHPRVHAYGKVTKGKGGFSADKTGLPFVNETKDFAVSTATHAIQCARTLIETDGDPMEPIYFYSDSNDLMKHMAFDLPSTTPDAIQNQIDLDAHSVVSKVHLISRNSNVQNAHIDRQKNRPAQEYYNTFVDLYLAIGARCIVYGVGYYAKLAAKISGTQCRLQHQDVEWGFDKLKDTSGLCTPDFYRHLT